MKKSLIFAMVAIVLVSVVFTACNKDVYVNPQTGEKSYLVTDENGKKVLSKDGELIVYVTDENGKVQKDEDGVELTEIQGFIGQFEENGVVEDYAYYFTIPEGWKSINDRGEFENKAQNATLNIKVIDQSIEKYHSLSLNIYEALEESKEASKDDYFLRELEKDGLESKLYLIGVGVGEETTVTMYFVNSKNTYTLTYTSHGDIALEDAEAEMMKIFDALEFKPYTYYDSVPGETTESPLLIFD